MSSISITGFGSYLPKLRHTNASLPPLDEPMSEEEYERIGVQARHWAGPEEDVAQMAAEASRVALQRAGVGAEELDLIVLSNWTQRRYIPEWAPRLQALLGAKAFAFDVGCACAGFLTGLELARGWLRGPGRSRALVVAAEQTSRRARPGSKGTVILGDAAGAFVLEAGERGTGRLIDVELATHGDRHEIMDISPEGHVRTHLAQRELNQLAGRTFGDACRAVLQRNGVTLDDVRWIVPHSGTAGVQAVIQRTLEVPKEKLLTNYADIGNVSSASIPAALDAFVARGVVRKGDLLLSGAVGTGWYAGALLYRV